MRHSGNLERSGLSRIERAEASSAGECHCVVPRSTIVRFPGARELRILIVSGPYDDQVRVRDIPWRMRSAIYDRCMSAGASDTWRCRCSSATCCCEHAPVDGAELKAGYDARIHQSPRGVYH